ncbi:MAG: hypothetical protein V3S30_08635, partial [Thermoanaerobaculia bacterium]
LRGRYTMSRPHITFERLEQAAESFQLAVELDPGFALAYAEAAIVHGRMFSLRHDTSDQRRQAAEAAVGKALKLAPNSPRAHLALAYHHLWIDEDHDAALTQLAIAQRGLPNSVDVLSATAAILETQGRWQEALVKLERAFELSPRDASLPTMIAHVHWVQRQYPEAVAASDRAIALAPDGLWPYLYKFFAIWSWRGAGPASRSVLETIPDQDDDWTRWSWFQQDLQEGNYGLALDRLASMNHDWIRLKTFERPKPWLEAQLFELMGEPGRATQAWQEACRLLEADIRSKPDNPRLHSSLGIGYAALGREQEAVREGNRATHLLPLSEHAFYGLPYVVDLAHIYTLVGDSDAAVDQLEFLLSTPSWISVPLLRSDPRWDPLRADPRFQQMMERFAPVELPPRQASFEPAGKRQGYSGLKMTYRSLSYGC